MSKSTILVVDDNTENLKVLSQILMTEKYNVNIATSGSKAIDSINYEKPNLILMDICMPEMDGYMTVKKIHSMRDVEEIPVIFVSALDSPEDKVKAFNLGGVDYITKPFNRLEVLSRIKTHIELYEYRKQLEESHYNVLSRYQSTFENSAIGILHMDVESFDFTEMNPKLMELLGIVEKGFKGLNISDVLHMNDYKSVLTSLIELKNGKQSSLDSEFQIMDSSNEYIWVKNSFSYVEDPYQNQAYILGFFEDISKMKTEEDELIGVNEKLTQKNNELELIQTGLIKGLGKACEYRDIETGKHINRMVKYVQVLLEYLKNKDRYRNSLNQEEMETICSGVPLHDIGKVAIPDSILLKPKKLTEDEFEVVKKHTTIGKDMIQEMLCDSCNDELLSIAKEIACYHHEKWDGSGYPLGLTGFNIPVHARVVALADVYDALTRKKVYKEAVSHEKAKTIIRRESGFHFDPEIVKAFLELEDKFVKISLEFQDN